MLILTYLAIYNHSRLYFDYKRPKPKYAHINIPYKIKEKTSKGICIGILHIPLSSINITT